MDSDNERYEKGDLLFKIDLLRQQGYELELPHKYFTLEDGASIFEIKHTLQVAQFKMEQKRWKEKCELFRNLIVRM